MNGEKKKKQPSIDAAVDSGPETLVTRIEREVKAMVELFRRNKYMAILVMIIGMGYLSYKLQRPHILWVVTGLQVWQIHP